MDVKQLGIRFDKVDAVIQMFDGIRYLELPNSRIYDAIHDRINYLISKKSDGKYSINHNYAKIRIDSYNSLPTEKALTFRNAIILIKPVLNKNKNYYYFNTFLEKVRMRINNIDCKILI